MWTKKVIFKSGVKQKKVTLARGVENLENGSQRAQMIILMLTQVIRSMENGNDDVEPGNRIFAERDPNDHSDAVSYTHLTLPTILLV